MKSNYNLQFILLLHVNKTLYLHTQPEDYVNLKGGLEEHLNMLVRGNESPFIGVSQTAVKPVDPHVLSSLPTSLEARLPLLDQDLKLTHAEWLPVTNTR